MPSALAQLNYSLFITKEKHRGDFHWWTDTHTPGANVPVINVYQGRARPLPAENKWIKQNTRTHKKQRERNVIEGRSVLKRNSTTGLVVRRISWNWTRWPPAPTSERRRGCRTRSTYTVLCTCVCVQCFFPLTKYALQTSMAPAAFLLYWKIKFQHGI